MSTPEPTLMALQPQPRFVVDTPRVYVVGVQQLDWLEIGRFLIGEGFDAWTTAADQPSEILVEVAGRLCYLSFGGGREHREYIENLKRERHGSVLEHAVASVILTGVSRSFTHEVVRHRAGWSYSQLSQRYVEERHAQVVCPDVIAQCRDDPEWGHIHRIWEAACRDATGAYTILVEELRRKLDPAATVHGAKPQTRFQKLINGAARSILPNATETKLFATFNARAFRHFLEMRASQAADPEIRLVAMTLYRAMLPHWPEILADYQVRTDRDGRREYLTTEFPKV